MTVYIRNDPKLSAQGVEAPLRGWPAEGRESEHVDKIETILGLLDVARTIADVNVATFRLHALTGDLAGYWSVTVRANWRIIFRFADGDAFDVDLVDYH